MSDNGKIVNEDDNIIVTETLSPLRRSHSPLPPHYHSTSLKTVAASIFFNVGPRFYKVSSAQKVFVYYFKGNKNEKN